MFTFVIKYGHILSLTGGKLVLQNAFILLLPYPFLSVVKDYRKVD